MKITKADLGKAILPAIFILTVTLLLVLPIMRSPAANPSLTNADFETGPFNTQGTATGWTATAHAAAVDFEGGTNGTTHAGALSLGGDFTGDALSQSFNTTSGASYTLAFDAGIFGRRDGGPLQVEVQVTGTGTLSDTTITPPDAGTWTASQVQFSHFTVPFTANSATTTIKFIAVGSGNANADQVIDTVSVVQTSVSTPTPTPTATPSPSSTVCAAQGAVADACYAIRPPPCTSGQAFWFPNADCNIPEGNDCLNPGSDPSSGTDGFKYIFTAASGNTTPTSGTFTENANGTANLSGHLESTLHPGYGFDVNINWTGRTTNPNLPGGNGPLLELKSSCYSAQGGFVNPATWHFYQNVSSATLTGTGNYAGAIVQLIPVMHFFQVGDGASGKNINSGASGWFTWVVSHQPTNTAFCLRSGSQVGRTADFNFNCNPTCTGQIGDFVWQDNNQNGCQDAGEPGIPNVQVDLLSGCGTGAHIISTTHTDNTGHYLFTSLCAGQYTVRFTTPTGFTHTVANAACNVNNQPSDTTDSDCTCTGSTSPCDVCVTLPTDSSSDLTIDCGYIPPCTGTIGDFVWQDNNQNGCQDAGEPGIPGVQVDLYTGCGANKVFKQTTTTDSTGHYLFTGLCAGDYTVCFHTPNGFTNTIVNSSACDTAHDSNCSSVACDICVHLALNNSSDLTIDCGYIPSCPACVNPNFGLGAGAAFSVFELANGTVSVTGPAGGIIGDIAIGPNGTLSMSGDEFVTGTIRLAPGAKFSNSAHFTPTVQTNVDLTAAINAAKNLSTTDAALPCDQTFAKVDGSAVTNINATHSGVNVICIKDVTISGKQVFINNPSNFANVTFVLNITGQFTLTGGGAGPQIRAGTNVKPADILYNLIGTTNMQIAFSGGGGGTNCCAAIVDGTLLAVDRSIALSPGLVNGEIISGKNISIVSGSAIKCPPCP